ncbi:MAG TPA: hypothetical protein PKD69_09325 [Elusimicrobiota bacterium]|nr:hypothetical protein [Elusimicrobiota bacterium]
MIKKPSETKSKARVWLEQNANPFPLATNRFGTKKNALSYVKKLEALGAVDVKVADVLDEPWRIKKEKGPYATSLKVTLPDAKAPRKRLFTFFAREKKHPRAEVPEEKGQRNVILWWD